MTQFMPGTYTRYMTDGDGDGRIDTLRSRVDALATTARYLKSLGWTAGLPWGIEVRVPESIARSSSSSQTEHACLAATDATGRCKRLDHWASLGLRRVDGRPLLGVSDDARIDWPALGPDTPLALLTPAGPQGPAWLVSRNFQSLWRYNRADAYALAVGQLSSALRGDAAQQSAWPGPDAALALSRNGTAELQGLLIAQGHCNLTADGYDGPATRLAVQHEERRRGLPETGRPTSTLLALMRAAQAAGAPPSSHQPNALTCPGAGLPRPARDTAPAGPAPADTPAFEATEADVSAPGAVSDPS